MKIRSVAPVITAALLLPLLACFAKKDSVIAHPAQRRVEYGINVTIAVYQFNDANSKKTENVIKLRQTLSSADEEIEYISGTYGIEEMKIRHLRSIGLTENETFTDAQGMNDKLLTFSMTPLAVSREAVSFKLTAKYDGKSLMDFQEVSSDSYETILLRGGIGTFGIREFSGPNGVESVPEKRGLLMTITSIITPVRGLQNRPSDLSRAVDQYGASVRLTPEDVFVMPSVLTRITPKFVTTRNLKGTVVLEGVITPDGRVTNIRVLDSPDPAYNPKFIETFRQYKFGPALLNGKPTYATWRETFILNANSPQ
jgi:TonB family protein